MRKLIIPLTLIAVVVLALPVGAQDSGPGGTSEPAHLVLSVDNGGEAHINRMDWDINAWSPLLPATSVRSSDYIDLAGRTTVKILCTDLVLLDQLGSQAPACNAYPTVTAFFFTDDPTWTQRGGIGTVTTLPADMAIIPEEVDNPGAYNLRELSGGELDTLLAQVSAVLALDVSPEARAYALSSLYRGQGALFEALGTLTALPDLGCTRRRPAVDVPTGESRPLTQSPALYIRIGELYEMLNQPPDAQRSYGCAVDLAQALGDTADLALAQARWANIADDPGQAIQFYQQSINNYWALGALTNASAVLEICGSRNCTAPQ